MTLTTGEQVRLRIQDPWRYGEELRYGDGTASAFKLQQGAPYSTIISATASVLLPAPTGWSATAGVAISTALGRVVFSGIISANTAWQANYLWAVFSDEEIAQFTADGGSVPGAALYAVRSLRFNAMKRSRWAAPDGTQYDDTMAMRALKELQDDIEAEVVRYEEGPAGGYASWAEQQENY